MQSVAQEVVYAAKCMPALLVRTTSSRWFLEYRRKMSVNLYARKRLPVKSTHGKYLNVSESLLIPIPSGMTPVKPWPTSASFSLTVETRSQAAQAVSQDLRDAALKL